MRPLRTVARNFVWFTFEDTGTLENFDARGEPPTLSDTQLRTEHVQGWRMTERREALRSPTIRSGFPLRPSRSSLPDRGA